MNLIPAIDIKNGSCVRLLKGDFDQVTTYSDDPVAIGRQFGALDVTDLHIVDLDGARNGHAANTATVESIIESTALHVQLGGGIRSESDVRYWLEKGVQRCVVGSTAIEQPENVIDWVHAIGAAKFVIALDVKVSPQHEPIVMSRGWETNSGKTLWDLLDTYCAVGVKQVLCTDIDRDGASTGPNVRLYQDILSRFPDLQLQASGGIRHVADLESLREAGLPAAISGRALLEGDIGKEEIVSFQRSA